jgi:hypothetical protein
MSGVATGIASDFSVTNPFVKTACHSEQSEESPTSFFFTRQKKTEGRDSSLRSE